MRSITACFLSSLPVLLAASACSQHHAPDAQSAPASPVSARVGPQVIGHSPHYLGIEMVPVTTRSNQSLFLRRLGVNGVRAFITVPPGGTTLSNFLGSAWGVDGNGNAVTSAQAFQTAQSTLANQANLFPLPDPWNNFLGMLQAQNLAFMAQLDLPTATFDFTTYDSQSPTYWQERWGFYTYTYQLTRLLLAQNVRIFETQNEPELELPTVQDALDRIALTSLAVRQAAADAPNSPAVSVLGPVSAKTHVPLDANSWLLPALDDIHTVFNGAPNPNSTQVDFLSFHRYGGDANAFTALLDNVQALEANANARIPMAVSEFNASDAAELDTSASSSDTPQIAATFLSEAAALAPLADQVNAFTFGMTADSTFKSGVKKNGIHWTDANTTSDQDVGGPTRSGEAYHFFARYFRDGTPLYAANATDSNVQLLSSADANNVYVLAINDAPTPTMVSIQMIGWQLPTNAPVLVSEVSQNAYGQAVALTAPDANGSINLSMPSYGIQLACVPRQAAAVRTIPLVSDNTLQPLQSAALTDQNTLRVAASTVATDDTSVAVLRFANANAPIAWAALHLTVAASDSNDSLLHVYGIDDATFDATQYTWTSSGIMRPVTAQTTVSQIADNLFNPTTPGARFLGSLFVPANSTNLPVRLDVTDVVNTPGAAKTFVIVREFLNNGTADAKPGPDVLANTAVTFYGPKASDAKTQPTLDIAVGAAANP